jgi:type IV secretory pathway VirB3-like protein
MIVVGGGVALVVAIVVIVIVVGFIIVVVVVVVVSIVVEIIDVVVFFIANIFIIHTPSSHSRLLRFASHPFYINQQETAGGRADSIRGTSRGTYFAMLYCSLRFYKE